jgi:hypothetical protein
MHVVLTLFFKLDIIAAVLSRLSLAVWLILIKILKNTNNKNGDLTALLNNPL